MTSGPLVVLSTAPSVNVLPGVRSIFYWGGRVQEADEALLVIKTERERYAALERRILALHSYSVPGVLALPVAAGAAAYRAWLREWVASVEGGEG